MIAHHWSDHALINVSCGKKRRRHRLPRAYEVVAREARTISRINHHHLIEILDVEVKVEMRPIINPDRFMACGIPVQHHELYGCVSRLNREVKVQHAHFLGQLFIIADGISTPTSIGFLWPLASSFSLLRRTYVR